PVIWAPLWHLVRLVLLPFMYGYLRTRRIGRHRIPRRGAVLVVCNHVSFIDPVVMAGCMRPRRVWLMAKEELFRSAPLAWVISRVGAFPVRRATADRDSIRTARSLLERGEALLLFPEGGVTRSGVMRPGFPGAGSLALVPGVTVVPAVIWNTQTLRGPVRVRFGAPIPMDDLRDGPRAGRNQRATERIVDHIAALVPLVGGPVQDGPRGVPWVPPPRADGKGVIRS
ncbi:MAG TPA: lysophospholipid acyltransferase family protein, partial [Miltoncostaeaceae bacterium]|nr:lysophospholipid acyltransferase family protein [Miltoncostaeaceae bacterium]